MVFALISILLLAIQASAEELPLQLLRLQEAYNVAGQLSTELWDERIPYEEFPVLYYDTNTREEYLVNHPSPDPNHYRPTRYLVNGRTVFQKIGDLTIQVPTGSCCTNVSGQATILLAFNLFNPTEKLISTFIHEGFHYYQFSSLFSLGVDSTVLGPFLSNAAMSTTNVNLENEYDLYVEGQILSRGVLSERELQQLVATEKLRMDRLDEQQRLFENFLLLIEGTAFFVESRAFRLLRDTPYNSAISADFDPSYSHFQGNELNRHYENDQILQNRLVMPSGIAGPAAYVFGRAFSRVLETLRTSNSGFTWQDSLFPGTNDLQETPVASTVDRFLAYLSQNNMLQRLQRMVALDDNAIVLLHREARERFLTSEAIRQLQDKVNIENNLDSYPFEDGWTYVVETRGSFPVVSVDNPSDLEFFANGPNSVLFSGYRSVEVAPGNITIEPTSTPAVPVVIGYLSGLIRFKDTSRNQDAVRLECDENSEGICNTLLLTMPGLRLSGRGVRLIRSEEQRQTRIQPAVE